MRRFAACLVLVSCSSFNGDASSVVDDGGMPSGDAGTDGGGPMCPGNIVYVSALSTTDSGDGCSVATAKKTIPAAIDRAKSLGGNGLEVHVCAGAYGEPVLLDAPVSVRGGYDCKTFERAPTFGLSPIDGATGLAALDTVNATLLETATATTTFTVRGAIPETVEIDGFFVKAPASTLDADPENPGTAAFAFSVGAATTLENCEISGAAIKAPNKLGTAGILIGDANPRIQRVRVSGGAAESTHAEGTGSAAVVGGSSARIRISGSSIDASAGIGLSEGSVGVVGLGSLDFVVEGNGFTRSGGQGNKTASVAIFAAGDAGKSVSIRNNRLHAASAAICNALPCAGAGISVIGAKAIVSGNYVDVGEVKGLPSDPQGVATYGIALASSSEGAVEDNVIHAGDFDAVTATVGISFQRLTSAAPLMTGERIVHNTIFATAGIALEGYTGVAIADNLLVAAKVPIGTDRRAGIVRFCPNGLANPPGTFSNNAFVGYGTLVYDGCQTDVPKVTTLAALSNSFSVTNGNTRLRTDCSGDPSNCKAVTGCDADCTASAFGSFQFPGHASLFASGWKLPSGAACLLGNGAGAVPAADVDGTARAASSAKGAYVFAGTCTP